MQLRATPATTSTRATTATTATTRPTTTAAGLVTTTTRTTSPPSTGTPNHGAHHPRTHRIDATIADFAERGWVTRSGERNERVELTDTGRDAYESALGRIQGLRQSMTAGIADADYATTIATLEAMARNLGWRERTAPGPGPDPDPDPS